MTLTESIVEDAALTWFGELGYAVGQGPQMAPGEAAAERGTFGEIVLAGSSHVALRQLSLAIHQSCARAFLRGTLPPKRLSGELRLSDAQDRWQ